MKKLFLLMLCALPLIATAQGGSGKWVTHSRFNISSAKNIIDTEQEVYYLVTNSLFRFDKASKTTTSLAETLGGGLVDNIYYNNEKKYLVVTYDDANINVITNDQRVINIPNIKDAVMRQSRTINEVSFFGDKMYVATGFGYVAVDDNSFSVVESRVYNINCGSIAVMGNWFYMFDKGNWRIYYRPCDKNGERLGDYTAKYHPFGNFTIINDSTFLLAQKDMLQRIKVEFVSVGRLDLNIDTLVVAAPTNVQPSSTGFIANFYDSKCYYTLNSAGELLEKIDGEQALYSSAPNADGAVWSVSANGLHNNKAPNTYYHANAIDINGVPWWMGYNEQQKKFYLMATSDNAIKPNANYGAQCEANSYINHQWENATPSGVSGDGWYWPVFDPNDTTDTYYISSRLNGVFKISNKKLVKYINANNSPWVARKAGIAFDSKGNFWMVHSSLNNNVPVKVLPKEKLQTNFTVNDWTVYKVPDVTLSNAFKRSSFDITRYGSDVKAFSCGEWGNPIILWRTDDENRASDKFESRSYTSCTTTDGELVNWNYIFYVRADRADGIALGTSAGLLFFNAPDAFTSDFAVTKTPGITGSVYCVEVDTLNRKWVGTESDGIYLLTPDCSAIIQQFTTSNSGLQNNTIYNMCCNTTDNSIFVVTALGVQQYFSDASDAAEDFNNITVYPNPVRPDFTGYTTIGQLMSNSIVLIKDHKGNVVKQLHAPNGTATWDGCNEQGERLPTGTYGIYATQNEGQFPTKPQAKIHLIK